MNNNAWFIKEKPLLSLQSMSGGAAGSLMQGAATKTYVDQVFSPYVYRGDGSARSINNGIDLSGEGGMVWIKQRDGTRAHITNDTVRGAGNRLTIDTSASASGSAWLSAFNEDGFTIGDDGDVNENNYDFTSWSFRKTAGFFDVVTFTGNASNRTISHSLGCVPGMYIVKKYNDTGGWRVYHKDIGPTKTLVLNGDYAATAQSTFWNDTAPTASVFSIGTDNEVNKSGDSFVCYLFAGGDIASGTSANIDITSKTVTNLGGNFDAAGGFPMSKMTDGILETSNAQNMSYVNAGDNTPGNPNLDVYVDLDTPHVVTKYRIGPQGGNGTSGYNLINNFNVYGTNDTSSWNFVAAFSPGQSGWSGGNYREFEWSTDKSYRYWRIQVTQGDSGNNKAISEWKIEGYSTAANTDSYVFGEDSDKNIISCGGYTGNGVDDGPQINCGWEPQYVMIKRTDSSDNWPVWDVIRGLETIGGKDNQLRADQTAVEHTTGITVAPTSTGFKIETLGSEVNANGGEYVYMAIRRPDGYVAKPPEAGTEVFAMDTGNSSAIIPAFDSTFPVDMTLSRAPASSDNWYATSRLTGGEAISPNQTWVGADVTDFVDDSNVGWCKDRSSSYQSWMWKRGAGFDVVCWEGQGSLSMVLPHSLGTTPEMIWTKNRDDTDNWICYHKGLNGGTNPQNYFIKTNSNDANIADTGSWYDTAPTATNFTVGNADNLNYDGHSVIAMLFASVEGISKVGYYTGDGGSGDTGQVITTGFQPRFLIIKRASGSGNWYVFDTLRGWTTFANNKRIKLNTNAAQDSTAIYVLPQSTGFKVNVGTSEWNNNGDTYLYYAHA